MKKTKSLYHGHRFPASIISHAVRWYFRFQLSLRDVEELLFERGVIVSHESIRRWTEKFGTGFAHRIKAARRQPGSANDNRRYGRHFLHAPRDSIRDGRRAARASDRHARLSNEQVARCVTPSVAPHGDRPRPPLPLVRARTALIALT